VPLVFFLARYRKNLPGNALLASLSYGVFLVHFLVIWFLDNAQTARLSGPVHVAAVTLGSTALAWIGVRFIERPVDRVRK
jgi:peptidoglycan/LPS O-acetylase OafA/YrhL